MEILKYGNIMFVGGCFFVQSRRYGALAVSMQTSVALYKPWGEGAVLLQLFVLQ